MSSSIGMIVRALFSGRDLGEHGFAQVGILYQVLTRIMGNDLGFNYPNVAQ